MPWLMPAVNTVSSLLAVKVRPLGCTVTEKLGAWVPVELIFLGILSAVSFLQTELCLQTKTHSVRCLRAFVASVY
jgi:hypothetical protein